MGIAITCVVIRIKFGAPGSDRILEYLMTYQYLPF